MYQHLFRSFTLILLVSATGCSLTSDEEIECSALAHPVFIADTTKLLGEWHLDHYRSFGGGENCAIQRVPSEDLQRSLEFRKNGTYTGIAGDDVTEGVYDFILDGDESLYRIELDSSSIPRLQLTPDTLVLDYQPVDGGQFVFLRE